MKCWVPCVACSYEQVAKTMCDELVKNPSDADVCIDDVIMFMRRFPLVQPKCKLWGDTMAYPGYYTKYASYPAFTVASKWNFEYFKRAGFSVSEYKPYPIQYVPVQENKIYTFIVVGVSRYFDRKNLSLIQELGMRDKTIVVSEPNPPIGIRNGVLKKVPVVTPDYHAFTLSTEVLHHLYAFTRFYLAFSVSEGIGLPPIEAMLHGVVPIYVNGHGYKDNLIGLPIDVRDEYTLEVDDYHFRIWEPSLHDMAYELNHALIMSRDEYDNLSAKVREFARSHFAIKFKIE